jgi:hypothetical protein
MLSTSGTPDFGERKMPIACSIETANQPPTGGFHVSMLRGAFRPWQRIRVNSQRDL